MKKLSKTMNKVLKDAINNIEKAKKFDYPEWLADVIGFTKENFDKWRNAEAAARAMEDYRKRYEILLEKDHLKDYWEMERNNIVFTHCNSATIRALEKYGYIRIIKDSAGDVFGIDKIEVINFNI